MNREKARIIESVRAELAEKEIKEHCTFHPKLQAKDFYNSRSALNRFFELKRAGDEIQQRSVEEPSMCEQQQPPVHFNYDSQNHGGLGGTNGETQDHQPLRCTAEFSQPRVYEL